MLSPYPGRLAAAVDAVRRAQSELDALGVQIAEARAQRDAALVVLNSAMQRAGSRTIVVGSQVYRAARPGEPAEVAEALVVESRRLAGRFADTELMPTVVAGLQS